MHDMSRYIVYRPAQSLTIMNRKLKITELNRISTEEFKEAEKLPLCGM